MSHAELHFRAMGTDCQILVIAPGDSASDLVQLGRDRVEMLEQCWSRFREDSDLNHLNAWAGRGPIPVSEDLLLLVERMVSAWEITAGLFDPTVLAAMRAHGYDADFDVVSARPAGSISDVVLSSTPGMSGVQVDRRAGTVALPAGIGIDPGAIGKGLAADVIAEELAGAGASGVLVNLGGDVSIVGADTSPWGIAVQDERLAAAHSERVLTVLEFDAEATRLGTATSTTLKRRWAQGRRHHVIDPRTGTMSSSPLVQVTLVANSAWEAEVLATAALLLEPAAAVELLEPHGVTAILLTADDITTVPEDLMSPSTHHPKEHVHG